MKYTGLLCLVGNLLCLVGSMFSEVVERLFTVFICSLFFVFWARYVNSGTFAPLVFSSLYFEGGFLHSRFSALTFIVFHAVLVLFQAICLNVAVNSHNKALLVIMVSNQVR